MLFLKYNSINLFPSFKSSVFLLYQINLNPYHDSQSRSRPSLWQSCQPPSNDFFPVHCLQSLWSELQILRLILVFEPLPRFSPFWKYVLFDHPMASSFISLQMSTSNVTSTERFPNHTVWSSSLNSLHCVIYITWYWFLLSLFSTTTTYTCMCAFLTKNICSLRILSFLLLLLWIQYLMDYRWIQYKIFIELMNVLNFSCCY